MYFFYLIEQHSKFFFTYFIGALYVHPLWFYKNQHDNLTCIVYDKLLKTLEIIVLIFVESQRVHV